MSRPPSRHGITRGMRLITPPAGTEGKCFACGRMGATVLMERITRRTLWQDRITGRLVCEGCVADDDEREEREEA